MNNVEQRRWEAEDDARTLARAQEITDDKKRHGKAITEAKKMAIKDAKRIAAMKKVANKKVPKKRKVVKKKK